MGASADLVIRGLRAIEGDVLLFSSGHFLRVHACRWLGFPALAGRHLLLGTACLSALGYGHRRSKPAIRFWNEACAREDTHR